MGRKLVKHLVTAHYMRERGYWMIFVHGGSDIKTPESLHFPLFDFSGKGFERNVQELANRLNSSYNDITKKTIEEAILKGCEERKMKPPKYLRKNRS